MSWVVISSWLLIILSMVSVAIEYRHAHAEPAVTDAPVNRQQTLSDKQSTVINLPSPSATDALLTQAIFSSSRSVEASIQQTAEPTEHTIFLNHYRLSAVAISENSSTVLMTDDKTNKVKHLQLNDELDGWTLEDISSIAAVFSKADKRRRVMLFNPQKPSLATTISTDVITTERESSPTFVSGTTLDDDPYQ
ncbi:hypothetical protein MAMP_02547 [Methylophaga aminisulfidivorans MP]|uniref:Uncharacterized protein n=2 Tax=Methylophaga TaxID=40222 RepID=F5SUW7_9GAMM|nr:MULTISPECIES: hypothetical protein [Methylophaga]EGL55553.1 hypothetical protein MAMP_02547 [Methylophaga aminisulfidivorans MP]GLP98847.1 hypothetical protein GCM10007891_07010 [Methylophaga thalassica]